LRRTANLVPSVSASAGSWAIPTVTQLTMKAAMATMLTPSASNCFEMT